ncbi:4Fe-4S dicluster domain-containing protein [Desulfovibrio sp. JC022]|uniref:4Fe-4S dicluster domain-containing protein n=1 Tax=Desulfovibrio sp. JC022 TaxID=2593642 RepID=UPI0013D80511|nr:4Fe-4S dicluster domain-containing protein [Desulfovibrio sp. JC022]NDV23517.1 4Fe-4S dicluster domain-containing protein [Desulfovibrio sp. JC022]
MNPLFSLTPSERGPIVNTWEQELGGPLVISLEITGLTPLVQQNEQVAKAQPVANDPAGRMPTVHSSISGTVTDIKKDFITIREEGTRVALPSDFSSTNPRTMLNALRENGINIRGLKQGCTLIINGMPHEAGMDGHRFLIEEFNDVMTTGLHYLKKALSPKACTLACPTGMDWTIPGCTGHEIIPVFPNSLPELVTKAITGKEFPPEVCVMDVATLYRIGRTIHGRQPATLVIVKVGNTPFLTPVGTPVGVLVKLAGFRLNKHDRVILGGPLTGEAVYSLKHGVRPDTQAITVLKADKDPTVKDNPCVGCGECVMHCPARLEPNMISRHAEFGLYENTQAYNIASCIECGLCGYWCRAQRPLLQYIRLAKKELAAKPILEDLREQQ